MTCDGQGTANSATWAQSSSKWDSIASNATAAAACRAGAEQRLPATAANAKGPRIRGSLGILLSPSGIDISSATAAEALHAWAEDSSTAPSAIATGLLSIHHSGGSHICGHQGNHSREIQSRLGILLHGKHNLICSLLRGPRQT